MNKVLLDENRRIIKVDDLIGENRLKIFDKIGLEAKYTDFAYALGGEVIPSPYDDSYISTYQVNVDKDCLFRVHVEGNRLMINSLHDYIAKSVRVVTNIPYEKENDIHIDENGIPYVYYDEYPQTVASKNEDYMIYKAGLETGNTYSISTIRAFCKRIEKPEDFKIPAKEYLLNGEKYVKIEMVNTNEVVVFSTGREVNEAHDVSFKVEPIKWILDEDTGILISEKILSSYIPYDYLINHKDNVKRLTKKKN